MGLVEANAAHAALLSACKPGDSAATTTAFGSGDSRKGTRPVVTWVGAVPVNASTAIPKPCSPTGANRSATQASNSYGVEKLTPASAVVTLTHPG